MVIGQPNAYVSMLVYALFCNLFSKILCFRSRENEREMEIGRERKKAVKTVFLGNDAFYFSEQNFTIPYILHFSFYDEFD